jgi:hypothetical protein
LTDVQQYGKHTSAVELRGRQVQLCVAVEIAGCETCRHSIRRVGYCAFKVSVAIT